MKGVGSVCLGETLENSRCNQGACTGKYSTNTYSDTHSLYRKQSYANDVKPNSSQKFPLGTFIKTERRSCYQNDYGRYNTLDDAKFACSNDSECLGIYDVYCNGPPFYLCPKGKELKISKSSCTYIKGMFISFCSKNINVNQSFFIIMSLFLIMNDAIEQSWHTK